MLSIKEFFIVIFMIWTRVAVLCGVFVSHLKHVYGNGNTEKQTWDFGPASENFMKIVEHETSFLRKKVSVAVHCYRAVYVAYEINDIRAGKLFC